VLLANLSFRFRLVAVAVEASDTLIEAKSRLMEPKGVTRQ